MSAPLPAMTVAHLRDALRSIEAARSHLDVDVLPCDCCGGRRIVNRVEFKTAERLDGYAETLRSMIGGSDAEEARLRLVEVKPR